jgi:transposase
MVGDLREEGGLEPRKPSPTDVTDHAWALIQPYVPQATSAGHPEKYPKRAILNGIFAILHGGA